MHRIVLLAASAWATITVSVLAEENRNNAAQESPPETTEVVWDANPMVLSDLGADMHNSEEWVPQVPNTGYHGEGGQEPTTHYLSTTTTTTTVPLPEWTGSIPEVYGEGSGCTQEEASIIARALWDRGASDDSVTKMLRIISRESLCDSSAHNDNSRTRDDSWGLCQQNNLSGWFDEGKLLENYDRYAFASDFALNAESCAVMWAECSVGPWNYGNYYCSTPKELR